jgi:hypothetical protein
MASRALGLALKTVGGIVGSAFLLCISIEGYHWFQVWQILRKGDR